MFYGPFFGLSQWVYVRDDMSKGLKIMSLGVINHGMSLSVPIYIYGHTLFDPFGSLFLCDGFRVGGKPTNFDEDHLMNIPIKFGSNLPSDSTEEEWNVKDYGQWQTDTKWWQNLTWTIGSGAS